MSDELARVKRIGMSMVPADWELSALAEVSALRAQNAELLAALREMVGAFGLVQRAICVAGESDPDVAMRNAKALLSRINGTTP